MNCFQFLSIFSLLLSLEEQIWCLIPYDHDQGMHWNLNLVFMYVGHLGIQNGLHVMSQSVMLIYKVIGKVIL